MSIKRLVPIVIVCLMLLPALSTAAQSDPLPAYSPGPCPLQFAVSGEVECGTLIIPQDRAHPNERTLNIAVAVFKSLSANPAPDPLIFLDGGPGSRTLDSFANGLGSFLGAINRRRDIIIFDYRGIGHSEPALTCPEGVNAKDDRWILDCLKRFEAEDVDVTDFTTRDNATDADDLVHALGYNTYNVWGGSYGSSVAMTLLRDHPNNVRAAIITALQPPEADLEASTFLYFQRTLDTISELCQSDKTCLAAYPNDLVDTLADVVERLETKPFTATINGTTVELDGITVLAVISELLKDEKNIPIIPGFITGLNAAQYDQVIPSVGKLYIPTDRLNPYGAWLSMRCTDSILATTPAAVEAVLQTINPAFHNVLTAHYQRQVALCEMWGARQPTEADRLPATTNTPVLIISGALDPFSSLEWLNSALATLPNGQGFMLPYHAHYVIHNSCASRLLICLIDDPTREVDSSRIAQILLIFRN